MGCGASTSADSPEDDALMAGVCFVQRSGKREDIKHGSPVRNDYLDMRWCEQHSFVQPFASS